MCTLPSDYSVRGPIISVFPLCSVCGIPLLFGGWETGRCPSHAWPIISIIVALAIAAPSSAQTPVRNPTLLLFEYAEHTADYLTGYEVDVRNATTGAVIQTIAVAKADTKFDQTTTTVTVTLNLQPVKFGTYTCVVRAVANNGTDKSDNSNATEP